MPLNSLTQYKQTSDVGDEEEDKGRGGGISTYPSRGEFHLHGIPRREARRWRASLEVEEELVVLEQDKFIQETELRAGAG